MTTQKHNPAGAPITACDVEQGCEVVSCATCLAEVPRDLATHFDGQDYVQHFCGLECMAQWQQASKTGK